MVADIGVYQDKQVWVFRLSSVCSGCPGESLARAPGFEFFDNRTIRPVIALTVGRQFAHFLEGEAQIARALDNGQTVQVLHGKRR